jgi:hypothetical protein
MNTELTDTRAVIVRNSFLFAPNGHQSSYELILNQVSF